MNSMKKYTENFVEIVSKVSVLKKDIRQPPF
jgi:hypothetical protein